MNYDAIRNTSETVFVEVKRDEYKYMVFFDILDLRKNEHRRYRKLVTLDHEFCEDDYRELENKYTTYTLRALITNVVKEPLV